MLIEDNPGDVDLTKKAFQKGKLSNNLNVLMDGNHVMEYLRQQGEFANKPRPDIILLDINLPGKSGLEVLNEIKQDDELAVIPVVMLTSSEADIDILTSYQQHANCYITKPVGVPEFIQVAQLFKEFWFQLVKLPKI